MEGPPTGRELLGYGAAMLSLGVVVAVAAWGVATWIGISGNAKWIIITQAPVVFLLLLWLAAIGAKASNR
jgi:hypothetical protein